MTHCTINILLLIEFTNRIPTKKLEGCDREMIEWREIKRSSEL
jgi:hypothetical protein